MTGAIVTKGAGMKISRHVDLATGALAAGAGAVSRADAALASEASASHRSSGNGHKAANRIDVHQHIVPPFWADGLREEGRNPFGDPIPRWSPELAIAFMDSQAIATGILSLTAPGIVHFPAPEHRRLARAVNDYGADLVRKNPKRFRLFATLPLPDIDGALAEVAHAFDQLGADGVVLCSNYDGRYLGDPLFEPLWAELNRRDVVVFVHPDRPPIKEVPGTPGPFVDFPFDTTRTAVDMVLKGVLARHPRLRVILSHGGGFLPYAAYRFTELSPAFLQQSMSATDLKAAYRRYYFDTALTSSPSSLPSLTAFAAPGHILFGSDFPYAPSRVSAQFTANLDASPISSARDHDSINQSSAAALFPRLAS